MRSMHPRQKLCGIRMNPAPQRRNETSKLKGRLKGGMYVGKLSRWREERDEGVPRGPGGPPPNGRNVQTQGPHKRRLRPELAAPRVCDTVGLLSCSFYRDLHHCVRPAALEAAATFA